MKKYVKEKVYSTIAKIEEALNITPILVAKGTTEYGFTTEANS